MAIKQRKTYRDMVMIIFSVIVALIILHTIILHTYRMPIIYFVFLSIETILLASFIIFIMVIMGYLSHVSTPPRRDVFTVLRFIGLLIAILLIYLFYSLSLEFTLVGVGILPLLTKSPVPLIVNVVNATLEEYVPLNCHGMNISNLGNLNETASILSALPQSLAILFLGVINLVIVASLWSPTIPLLKSILEHSSGGKEGVYNTLCHGDRWLLYSYMAATLITYFMGFSIIIYSLAILSSSEFPYAYAMLVTTFLVLIAEALMIHDSRDGSQWLWVALLISVVSSLIYTVVAFYINGFILPSTCFVGINDVLGIYKFSLLLAGIFGAIPYVSTLSIIHYRIMCPQVKAEEIGHRSVEEHGSSEMANSGKRVT